VWCANRDLNILENYLKKADVMSSQVLRDRLFYLLAALDDSKNLIEYGLSSADADVRLHAIVTAATLQTPTSALAGSLHSIAIAAQDSKTKCVPCVVTSFQLRISRHARHAHGTTRTTRTRPHDTHMTHDAQARCPACLRYCVEEAVQPGGQGRR
jgi:hypothetical protein